MSFLLPIRNVAAATVVLVTAFAIPSRLAAQTAAGTGQPAPVDSGITNPPATPAPDNRIFGVLPNYRTADGTKVFVPLTAKQKFTIATKDSFDWPNFLVAGVFSGFYQLDNQNPSFGQGIKGYAHRYVTSYADQVVGNMMTEAGMPALFHQDPRYFRLVHGGKWQRTVYALTRVVVCRTDGNGRAFNISEVLGNGISASLGNAYYPDNRGLGDTMQRMGTAISTDAISNVLKEFWPDIKRHFFKGRATADGV